MKVRKLAVALALAGGLGSGVAQALGLGEIELQSFLNEPLDAEIDLRKSKGINPGDVFVNIASREAYQRVGLDRNYFLTNLQFNVTTAPDGGLVINVSSREPLREPYLNFLVEVTWPQGRLMREYALLVDPPVYAEKSGIQESVAPAATTAVSEPAQPQPRQQAAAPSRRAEAAPARASVPATYGPTGRNDTLWQIAAGVRPDSSVSMHQVMLAIQDLNPDAFIDGNINRMKRGEVLRIPDLQQIRSRSRAEASRIVSAQNDALSKPRRTVDATAQAPATTPGASGASAGDELRLVVDEDAGSRSAEEGGSAGGDGQLPGGIDAGEAIVREELESARRENAELNNRLEDLQDQVATLQRLIELKNTQLAELQQRQGQAEDEAAAPAPGTTAQGEPIAPDGGDQSAPAEMMAEDDSAAAADTATTAETAPQQPTEPSRPEPAADKGYMAYLLDLIVNNPLYQIALGGGLLLLLLALVLLGRRNANRDKQLYSPLHGEAEGESDSFDLTIGPEEAEGQGTGDPLAEADNYIAYGKLDSAADSLENAISREPSRTDLRLKLLGVYADTKDRESFEKQFGEIEAMDDDAVKAEANELRARLEEAESMPSIDDLESQLRSESFGSPDQASSKGPQEEPEESFNLGEQTLADRHDEGLPETQAEEDDFSEFDDDFASLGLEDEPEDDHDKESGSASDEFTLETTEEGEDDDLSLELEELSGEGESEDFSLDFEEPEEKTSVADQEQEEASAREDEFTLEEFDNLDDQEPLAGAGESDEGLADFELADMETESEPDSESGVDDVLEEDSLELGELDEDSTTEELSLTGEEETRLDELEESSAEGDREAPQDMESDLDESFLDELDAELDKVAGEDDAGTAEETDSLEDLELDVSDEDIALMEEFSEQDVDQNLPTETDKAEPGLEDAWTAEEEADPEQAATVEESFSEDLQPVEPGDLEPEEEEAAEKLGGEEAAEVEPAPSAGSEDFDEADLGEDDDFDFLSGTDEAATKLDLARAYIEMEDADGARDILEEVALEGNDEQKAEAQALLKNLS